MLYSSNILNFRTVTVHFFKLVPFLSDIALYFVYFAQIHLFVSQMQTGFPPTAAEQVITAAAKISCRHGLWLVARKIKEGHHLGILLSQFLPVLLLLRPAPCPYRSS